MFRIFVYIYVTIADYQEFYDELLALHNEYRARHSAPPLSFDENVSNKLGVYLLT